MSPAVRLPDSQPVFQNHKTYPIAIIGGGFGGLALAIGLIKHGINVHIYEAAQEFSEIGAGVSLSVNSMKALQLIDPRLLDGFKKHNTIDLDPERADRFITVRWGTDQKREDGEGKKKGDFEFPLRDRETYANRAKPLDVNLRNCVHRARLLEVLVERLPKGIATFGKSFENLEELDDGTLRLHFRDGTTAMASAVIGCDGIKSKVRNAVWGRVSEPAFDNEVAYRAMVPRDVAEATFGQEVALNGHLYCGYGAYVVHYPVENRNFINVVACKKHATLNGVWEHDDWTVPTSKEEIATTFADWYPPLIKLLTDFSLPSKWAMFFMRNNQQYYRGRVCLLGDSAHASMPHLGGGAGMAMEDAYTLSNLIACVPGPDSLPEAFRAYDAVRRPRTQGLVERSQLAMNVWCLEDTEAGDNMAVVREKNSRLFKWLWNETLEEDVQQAKDMLRV